MQNSSCPKVRSRKIFDSSIESDRTIRMSCPHPGIRLEGHVERTNSHSTAHLVPSLRSPNIHSAVIFNSL